ncbi:MAG: hypothetical protein WKF75_00645 [Singulisphaera sp.]
MAVITVSLAAASRGSLNRLPRRGRLVAGAAPRRRSTRALDSAAVDASLVEGVAAPRGVAASPAWMASRPT